MSDTTLDVANRYIKKASVAAAIFLQFDQEQTDKIVQAVCEAGFNARVKLAKLAVEETGIGVVEHKILKNVIATQLIYEKIRWQKTVGVLSDDPITGIVKIAQPYGPILAITPVTNPTSTVLFKILICLKSRNPVIISPHMRAKKCCQEAAKICLEAAIRAGAPEDCIQIIDTPSIELTQKLMSHPKLGLILATGGPGLVKAAYSSGNPAIGVGPGNVPVFIEKSADLPFAVENIIISKTFDNGTICASEQSIVVEQEIANDLIAEFKKQNCYFLTPEESKKVAKIAIDPETKGMAPAIVGQSAKKIMEMAEIQGPSDTKILIAQVEKIGIKEPLSREILAPILSFYVRDNFQEAIKTCIDLNHFGGLGHTVSIFSNDEEKIRNFSHLMDAGRIIVNSPSSQGAVGGIFNMLTPSLTLGCGAGGKNITAENITATHLININLCCRRKNNERFCNFPKDQYYNESMKWNDILKMYNQNY